MLQAVAALCAEHGMPCQLAMEAAMACGFGACYGCAVELDGEWKRLCVEGPVLEAGADAGLGALIGSLGAPASAASTSPIRC